MQKRSLTAIGVLLSAALTIQMATAATRSVRKPAQAPDPVAQQLRDALVQWIGRQRRDKVIHTTMDVRGSPRLRQVKKRVVI
jgi:hypothetical protein